MYDHSSYPTGVTEEGTYADFVYPYYLLTALDRWAKNGEYPPDLLIPLLENDLTGFLLSWESPRGENNRLALVDYVKNQLPKECWGSKEAMEVWKEKKKGEKDSVTWIVTFGNDPEEYDNGEFGVLVNGIPYIYYKDKDPIASPDVKFREIEKREFGEVIKSPLFP